MKNMELPQPWEHPEADEDFLRRPSKVGELMKILDDIQNANKMDMDNKKKEEKVEKDLEVEVSNFSYIVTSRNMHTSSSKKSNKSSRGKEATQVNMNQMTFMRQIDTPDEIRQLARRERERVAENFRRLGNDEFRRGNYDKAIWLYTMGLTSIKDTPVLYVNRAMCNLKKREYKRAIIDCDYVINKLDERNVQAWLYRAAAFKRLMNEKLYEECVYNANKFNRSKTTYIEFFLEKMRTDL